jgi:hypothetical protein
VRYRLMATYRGVAYEAGVGPTDKDVVLFAALPPPEGLGFQPATGHWRKALSRAEVDAVWESRPSGSFGGEPCLVLDDLGEHLHISYLGQDLSRAGQLGYAQIEPGVFELLAAREDVTGITEDRVEHPFLPWQQGGPPAAVAAETTADEPRPGMVLADPGLPGSAPPQTGLPWTSAPQAGVARETAAEADPLVARQRRAAARSPRAQVRQVFAELVDLAAMPQDAYAVDEAVDGALCLVSTDGGFEVFSAADGVRQEVRFFYDEEAAYFYLFGLLAAEAVRDGRLVPPA